MAAKILFKLYKPSTQWNERFSLSVLFECSCPFDVYANANMLVCVAIIGAICTTSILVCLSGILYTYTKSQQAVSVAVSLGVRVLVSVSYFASDNIYDMM